VYIVILKYGPARHEEIDMDKKDIVAGDVVQLDWNSKPHIYQFEGEDAGNFTEINGCPHKYTGQNFIAVHITPRDQSPPLGQRQPGIRDDQEVIFLLPYDDTKSEGAKVIFDGPLFQIFKTPGQWFFQRARWPVTNPVRFIRSDAKALAGFDCMQLLNALNDKATTTKATDKAIIDAAVSTIMGPAAREAVSHLPDELRERVAGSVHDIISPPKPMPSLRVVESKKLVGR
jgi:hypothetical protein